MPVTIAAADLDQPADPMAEGSFKDVYRARLRRDAAQIGRGGLEVAVIQFRQGISTLASEFRVLLFCLCTKYDNGHNKPPMRSWQAQGQNGRSRWPLTGDEALSAPTPDGFSGASC
jgi:hypothetical protein